MKKPNPKQNILHTHASDTKGLNVHVGGAQHKAKHVVVEHKSMSDTPRVQPVLGKHDDKAKGNC